MFKFLSLLICLLTLSCVTAKWKKKYVSKKVPALISKYSKDSILNLAGVPSDIYASNRFLTKKKLKEKVFVLEKSLAIFPDSVSKKINGTDSFYYNPDKIFFLNKHNLRTKNMVFLN